VRASDAPRTRLLRHANVARATFLSRLHS
jgi:hypothetical protein